MIALSHTRCILGEGPMWHPERDQLFWFDILAHRLYTIQGGQERYWQFDVPVSAAGWVDHDTLLIASATALFTFNVATEKSAQVIALEADNPVTRSNDGRADPWGGFWIGTMGMNLEPKAGAIYRFYKGEISLLYPEITIPNAISFSPDKRFAYLTDTPTGKILRQPLDESGFPQGTPELFADHSDEDFGPDGAVVDSDGQLWSARWGTGEVACYAPDGTLKRTVQLPAKQASCPAFGGPDLTQLFVTTAADGDDAPEAGKLYQLADVGAKGQAEHRVLL